MFEMVITRVVFFLLICLLCIWIGGTSGLIVVLVVTGVHCLLELWPMLMTFYLHLVSQC